MDLRDVTRDRPMFHRVACVAARLCLSQRMRAGSLCEWGRKVNKRRLGSGTQSQPGPAWLCGSKVALHHGVCACHAVGHVFRTSTSSCC